MPHSSSPVDSADEAAAFDLCASNTSRWRAPMAHDFVCGTLIDAGADADAREVEDGRGVAAAEARMLIGAVATNAGVSCSI